MIIWCCLWRPILDGKMSLKRMRAENIKKNWLLRLVSGLHKNYQTVRDFWYFHLCCFLFQSHFFFNDVFVLQGGEYLFFCHWTTLLWDEWYFFLVFQLFKRTKNFCYFKFWSALGQKRTQSVQEWNKTFKKYINRQI